jgi:hypothetical protein
MKIIINLGREILLLGSVRESIMTPSETSSEKNYFLKIEGRNAVEADNCVRHKKTFYSE